METLAVGAATLLAGALIGYLVRLTEFRRDRRLQAYGDFIGAFLTAAHSGAALFSYATSLGDAMYEEENREESERWWNAWASSAEAFETATARLRLVASDDTRALADEVEDFITDNIRSVPPVRRGAKPAEWGAAASVGPAKIDLEAVVLARRFASAVSSEVTGWRERPRRPK